MRPLLEKQIVSEFFSRNDGLVIRMMVNKELTFELSGAAELRPVEPACWRNVLERFVMRELWHKFPSNSDTNLTSG